MPIVAVNKFRATSRATETQKHALPRDGATAVAACATHGAFDAVIERYSPLAPDALPKPQNKDFVPLHATALREGSAMLYYVNSTPPGEAPLVTDAGFRPSGRG